MPAITITAASVWKSYEWDSQAFPPKGPITGATQLTDGTPYTIDATGSLVETVLDGGAIGYVTNANLIFALSNEPFDGNRFPAKSTPIRQEEISVDLIFPMSVIEANLYFDGLLGVPEQLAQAMVGSQLLLQKVAPVNQDPFYAFTDPVTSGVAPANKALFRCIRLVDIVGTINGRIAAVPEAAYRLLA